MGSLSPCAVRDLCNPKRLFLPIWVSHKALLAGGVFRRTVLDDHAAKLAESQSPISGRGVSEQV
ncbi:hypothetical protein BN874_430006 [Candidatus Contendobacter odensis Run_B_J11]|uniref:Uncharacterized protein n=1 Tax=Candidatus Contendobacter odensis Run_B_J11 TaxID=1400861 RepID=A0A7U7GDN1_9GAMM|nr:hypothetical protein BN874_430006 [Candidatus Contendobacter odensis Run_B_J11]